MLILAGISLNLITGGNGIVDKAEKAVDVSKIASAKEQVELLLEEYQFNFYEMKYVEGTINTEIQSEYILENLKKEPKETKDYRVITDNNGKMAVYEKKGISKSLIITGQIQEDGTINWDDKELTERPENPEPGTEEYPVEIIEDENGIKNINGESLIEVIRRANIENEDYYKVNIDDKDESYTIHTYVYNGDQIWDDQTFGDADDVGTAEKYAQNMVVVKVNGNLTINEDAMITAYNTIYGGPKGMLLCVSGTLTNNGTISMTARGAYAEGQDVYIWKNTDGSCEYVPALGGIGGNAYNVTTKNTYGTGYPGNNGNDRKTGGGGSAGSFHSDSTGYICIPKGGNGTSYSGGTGSGAINDNCKTGPTNALPASDIGGTGGLGRAYRYDPSWMGRTAGGGTGNPGGNGGRHTSGSKSDIGNAADLKGNDGTGGLLIIYSNQYDNKGNIEANGVASTNVVSPAGGASGGGSINIFYNKLIANNSCVANGGASACYGGAGGEGCVTMGNISTGSFVKE